jgi:hypothetical protein
MRPPPRIIPKLIWRASSLTRSRDGFDDATSSGNRRTSSLCGRLAVALASLILFFGSFTAEARDYFFDAQIGIDENDGSEFLPLRTIARANDLSLGPGDRLLFQAGQTFAGNLVVAEPSYGTPAAPIVIGSCGEGCATIEAGAGTGVWAHNLGGIVIQDLSIVGAGPGRNIGSGVRIENTLPGNITLDYVRIARVTCRGFAGSANAVHSAYGQPCNYGEGIFVGGRPIDGSKSGYRDVRIEDCETAQNQYYGILVSGAWNPALQTLANQDVAVIRCRAHHNLGDPAYLANHSGNGILLQEVDGGTIENCQAWENGTLCACPYGGPVGIWAATANRIVIRDCVAYANHTASHDGAGFDLDGGVSNSTIEHCTSRDNDGAGILLYTYAGSPNYFGGNVVRHNVSANDGKKNGMAGIAIGRNGGRFEGVEIDHNIIFASAKAGSDRGVSIFGTEAREILFHDNVIFASDGALLIEALSQPGLVLVNNAFWCGGSQSPMVLDGQKYASLADWRQTTGRPSEDREPALSKAIAELSAEKIASWAELELARVGGAGDATPRREGLAKAAPETANPRDDKFPGNVIETLGVLLPQP